MITPDLRDQLDAPKSVDQVVNTKILQKRDQEAHMVPIVPRTLAATGMVV